MTRGEIWWADLGIPYGSEPGYKRPVIIIQDDAFNRSRIQTVIVSSITTNLHLAEAPGNVYIDTEESGLPKAGIINISQISTLDKRRLIERVGLVSPATMNEVDFGIKTVLNIQ